MTTPGFLYIDGSDQGSIKGSAEHQDGAIEIYHFQHSVEMKKNLMLNQKFHQDIEIKKPIDKSTPKLYQALCSAELLSEVRIVWFPFNDFESANKSEFYQITLEEALITKIDSSISFIESQESAKLPLETIYFSYKRINWVWLPDGIEFEDEWGQDNA